MSDSDQHPRPAETVAARPGKVPYEKPAVVWEEVLEVRAGLMAGCGKIEGSGDPCDGAGTS